MSPELYTFLMSVDDSLNELTPLEVLHGSPFREHSDIEPCQQRILDLPRKERNAKVFTLWRMHEADERDRAAPAQSGSRAVETFADHFSTSHGHHVDDELNPDPVEHWWTFDRDALAAFARAILAAPHAGEWDAVRMEALWGVLMCQVIETSSESYLALKCVGIPPTAQEFAGAVNRMLDGTPAAPSALADVLAERKRQDEQWGGQDVDDTRRPAHWIAYIAKQVNKADRAWIEHHRGEVAELDIAEIRERLVKTAALAVAAIESIDRKGAQR
ncbi:hypothetical protein AWB80_08168 [Caballeronia pedi]|uniref:Uncharacterized protein n=1 Tax=Caballeronia pedi TaxID=1777141 RepID=A0A158E439_9BURK|nr:hypothetical protein [Caballeronia pedi]SAL01622.1 hypothetical protein AWB80_08168 [Caballeronia pedi]